MKRSTHSVTEETHLIALLAAFCMFLSMIEYLIPKPLPFMRLGLANLPILLALSLLPSRRIIFLVFLKVLGQGLVNGTMFSYIFLFSAAGSFASGCMMLLTSRLFGRRISLVGVCVFGALASNSVQILIARQIIFGRSALLIGPPFLFIGLISSLIMGFFAEAFQRKSRWFEMQLEARDAR